MVLQRYARRIAGCEAEIKKGRAIQSQGVNQWKYLLALFKKLGPEGVSSDESGVDGDGNEVAYVKCLPWRPDIEEHIRRVDYRGRPRMKGAKPMRRVREKARVESKRDAYVGRAAALYDRTWLGKQTTAARKALCISSEPFSLKRLNN
jgi:hypothetical protein